MRNRVLWNSPRVRFSLFVILTLIVSLVVSGCGGGSGGNVIVPPPPVGNLATVSGIVRDNTTAVVANALVTIINPAGRNLQARTASDGTFSIFNVPLATTHFLVNTPDASKFYDVVQYLSVTPYDTDPNRGGGACKLPLPTLVAGQNNLPGTVIMFSAASGPPPPPAGTCP